MVDFGNVCIGQCEKLELTLKSITDVPLKLTCRCGSRDHLVLPSEPVGKRADEDSSIVIENFSIYF